MSNENLKNEARIGLSLLNAGLDTELTLSNENGEYSVLVRAVEMNIEDMFEKLIEPMLLAAGYSPTVINEYLRG